MSQSEIAFLFDVDNTLLDNDGVISELKSHLESEAGAEREQRYWSLFEQLRNELGYADYLGALQRYRSVYPHDPSLLTISRFLLNYPFADRLFPHALEVIEHVGQWGPVAILTDGDVIFQPHKIDRSDLSNAVAGRVFIYVHKEEELDDVEQRFPAKHYVLIEDKLRILTAVKENWGSRVTTIFVNQGHYARDQRILAQYPAADMSIESIGDLLRHDFVQLLKSGDTK